MKEQRDAGGSAMNRYKYLLFSPLDLLCTE